MLTPIHTQPLAMHQHFCLNVHTSLQLQCTPLQVKCVILYSQLWFSVFACHPDVGVDFAPWLQFPDGSKKSHLFSVCSAFFWLSGWEFWLSSSLHVRAETRSSRFHFLMLKNHRDSLNSRKSNILIKIFFYFYLCLYLALCMICCFHWYGYS